jgi:hypothetical protein
MYLVGLLFAFSGDLVQQIQTVRHQNQINKINQIEIISISLSQWNEFENKHEIKLEDIFYDVVAHSITSQKVTLKVVKDHFENEVRVVFSQVFNKSKYPTSDKKKSTTSLQQIVCETKSNWVKKNIFTSMLVENFNSKFELKTNSYIYLPQKPPCI